MRKFSILQENQDNLQSILEVLPKTKLEKQELMTTKELADFLKTSPKVVLENAKKCLPNKKIENGKPTYWNKAEVTVLLDCLKNNPQTNSSDLYLQSKGYETDLTPALKLKKSFRFSTRSL